ncbi:N(4)-(Beta-N-acetylglucosaminyl)-L-asparaginase [Anabrus simplex]|uniref:N(4)-(Beta-N-acetylglucosaminyl)-L-asparaginase n=1 Tax=Anabrus simplex TaxID=316456 RepID=UPI0034DD6D42
MMTKYLLFMVLYGSANSYFVVDAGYRTCDMFPVVLNTWAFTEATEKAWETVYLRNKSAVDAIEAGCTTCEKLQCDGTVGYGGSPDESGETTLDAMIMDGETMNMGAVGALRRVKSAISVARHVMDYTDHSMLVGDQATRFALSMGFKEESLQTETSHAIWKTWKDNCCQPNFWVNVSPDPKTSCGPYKPNPKKHAFERTKQKSVFSEKNHDTIGMVAIDFKGRIAAGTSTNGARHKIPGRVGDSPIPGAGAYADGNVGAAAATGDGDVMMRFLPSLLAVEEMRKGESPGAAGEYALRRIAAYYPDFVGGIVVLRKDGEYGAACHGLSTFPFSVCTQGSNKATVHNVTCMR